MYGSESTVPFEKLLAEPTGQPPDVQSGLEPTFGPQTKNLTEPLTGPFAPERVAVSVTDWPVTTELLLAVVSKFAGIGRIDAAASERSWLPPLPSSEISRMWYGEPGIAPALEPRPQSICDAM